MDIVKKYLSESGIVIELVDPLITIDAVYIDNISEGYNYDEVKETHDIIPLYELKSDLVIIKAPDTTSTFCCITLIAGTDSEKVYFLNEFSVFKAKSNYLKVMTCEDNCSDVDTCRKCDLSAKQFNAVLFMMRLNLFHQSYTCNNIRYTIGLYISLCRHYDLNNIPFTYFDLCPDYHTNPGKLNETFHKLNEWIRHSKGMCENKVLDCLLLGDLYDLIFLLGDFDGRPEWILDDHIWNMKDEYWFSNGIWKD